MKRIFTPLLLLLIVGVGLSAQSAKTAQSFLQSNYARFGLAVEDVADLRVTDDYASPGGVEHVYLAQYHAGIPIHNAQAILHLRGGKIVSQSIGLARQVAATAPHPAPASSAQNAVFTAASEVAPAFGRPIAMAKSGEENRFVWPAVSEEPLSAQLTYLSDDDGLTLAWRILIDQHKATANYYLIMVDANTGAHISTTDLVLHCDFGGAHQHDLAADCRAATPKVTTAAKHQAVVMDGATYNVFPFGVESPIHGDRALEVDPADETASPFGWHDTNGEPGPEFTITRGNNAYAYPDREIGSNANDNTPDGETADGGADLVFDFPFAQGAGADDILQASMVQAFYTTNKVHDWLYKAGFTEAAGNFQENNYGPGGRGGDPVDVEVQDGTATGNANFFTPADGSNPRMQMMLFNSSPGSLIVTEPNNLAATYATGEADFGPDVALNGPYEGELALGLDASDMPNLACQPLINGAALSGKIALVTRGNCLFVEKVLNAQDAGAIGVLICNNVDGIIGMTGDPARQITIPTLSTTTQTCDLFRAAIAGGQTVNVRFEEVSTPPIDSDFDAGIVAHEIGHGVSNRLVGGPSSVGCLRNDEQMGEGWSDFFALAATPQTLVENPDGSEARGIGNYAISSNVNGRGIRSQPYSTNRAINDKTYNNVIYDGFDGAPHPLGEVWAATLWDIYWYYTNKDGFDPDVINGDGGNNKAVRLVVEGMKYTRCSPGLVDARDGILEANRVVFGGENQCELYQLFASRGLGFSADQGTNANRTDNSEGFDITPYCAANIELKKSVDVDVIEPGEIVGYTLKAFSYRPGATENVTIIDSIPEGMTIDVSSIEGATDFTLDGNVITFSLGSMAFEDEVVITYDVTTDQRLGSESYFFDGAEDGDDRWELIGDAGISFWKDFEESAYEGDLVWFVSNVETVADQSLQITNPILIEGENPGLRFFTQYDTEAAWDAGILETSTDNSTWARVSANKLSRGAYRGEVAPTATEELRGGGSFWGDSQGYQEIIVDLNEFKGQEIYFRFRFLSDANTGAEGWYVDNIELLDVFNYAAGATLISDEGDNFVANEGDLGVLVENGVATTTDVTDAALGRTSVEVYPNPAGASANVRITAERAGAITVRIMTADGRSVAVRQLSLTAGANLTTFATDRLPSGLYLVQVTGVDHVTTGKLTVR